MSEMKQNKQLRKILFLTHVGDPGGAEFIMLRLCEAVKEACKVVSFESGLLQECLRDRNISHEVIPMPEAALGVRREGGVIDILKAMPGVISMLGDLVKESRKHDIIICMSQKSFILSAIARVFVRKPLIWFMNDLVSPEHFGKLVIFLMTKVFACFADKIVLNSQASFDAWGKSGGDLAKAVVIYPGTYEREIDKALEQSDKIAGYRKRFSEDGASLIGIFGRICTWKGQDVFLEALAKIPKVRGVVVGEAFFDQGHFQEKLDKIVQDNNLESRVVFAGHSDSVPCVMAGCDVVVHASTQPEPFGLVIVEAMMCGKPVIATNAGGAREIIIDHESGLLTEPGGADALAEAIRYYLDNPEQAVKIAACGRARAIGEFSNTAMIEAFKELLDEV